MLCCVFHPSQLLLISGGDDSQIKIWDLVSKSCVCTLQAHFSAVTSLSISDDGWNLVSGGRDGVVVQWNLKNYSKLATVPVFEAVETVVALPTSLRRNFKSSAKHALLFASGGENGIVKIWRSDTATCVSEELPGMPASSAAGSIIELHRPRNAQSEFDLLVATQDCRLLFLGIQEFKIGLHRQFIGNNDEVTDLRFLPGNDSTDACYIASATNGEQIHIIDAISLNCSDTLTGHSEAVLALDYTQTRSMTGLLASGSKDTTVRVWKVVQGKGECVGIGTGHVGTVTALSFSNHKIKNDFLISGGSDKLLRSWDISKLEDSDEKNGSLVATAAISAHDKDINAVAVSPNDAFVASASQDKTIKVWRTPDLVLAMTLRGHRRGVWAINFSPVDQALVSASGDKTIKLWNLKDGSCLRTFEGHLSSVLRVNFLSAGTQLLSAGADGLLKLWNIRTSEAVGTFDAHEDKVWALAIEGSSGNIAASGGGDGSIAIWEDCTESDKLAAAKEAETFAIQEQTLENAIHMGKWSEAAELAIDMGRPGQLLGVIQSAIARGKCDKASILVDVSKRLNQDQLKTSLEFCREWNTHSKSCSAAQAFLHAIFCSRTPEEVLSIPGCHSILEGIQAYTQRHTSRVDRLIKSSYIVDFILASMGALTPTNVLANEDTNTEVPSTVQDDTKDKAKPKSKGRKKRRVN